MDYKVVQLVCRSKDGCLCYGISLGQIPSLVLFLISYFHITLTILPHRRRGRTTNMISLKWQNSFKKMSNACLNNRYLLSLQIKFTVYCTISCGSRAIMFYFFLWCIKKSIVRTWEGQKCPSTIGNRTQMPFVWLLV